MDSSISELFKTVETDLRPTSKMLGLKLVRQFGWLDPFVYFPCNPCTVIEHLDIITADQQYTNQSATAPATAAVISVYTRAPTAHGMEFANYFKLFYI